MWREEGHGQNIFIKKDDDITCRRVFVVEKNCLLIYLIIFQLNQK